MTSFLRSIGIERLLANGRRHFSHGIGEPLRIAYFGSDQFSVTVLDKIVKMKERDEGYVESVDIVTRSIKPTGRKLKKLVDVPVGSYGTDRGIRVHRAESDEDIVNIARSHRFNIGIAVSYGKLIPETFIDSMRFGGLNVHPSFLPKYSGSSPIQYALMNDDAYTGVTVQTLHPTKFDRGRILAQSEKVCITDSDDFASLQMKLASVGGDLLASCLENRYFEREPVVSTQALPAFSLARKLNPKHRNVDWLRSTSRQIKRLRDALGNLHLFLPIEKSQKGTTVKGHKKVVFNAFEPLDEGDCSLLTPGQFRLQPDQNYIVVKTIDKYLAITKLTFECCKEEDAKTFMEKLPKRCGTAVNRFHTGYL